MINLIRHGLMFGNLFPVSSPALVERYNRALKHLTGYETKLTDFHVDISGFAPEVADELGDPLYLNPNGVNRKYILLSTQQKTAPLLDAKFSTSRGILRRFIDENEDALFALTTKDAVAGELMNSVYEVTDPTRLLDIGAVTIAGDTAGGQVADARVLEDKIKRFRSDEDAWFNDVLIAEMISLAQSTGDITRNPISLDHMRFEPGNFWTAHFGGIYLFPHVAKPGAICAVAKADLPLPKVMSLQDRNAIALFLQDNELAEPIVRARDVDAAPIIRQKMDFVLVDAAATLGENLKNVTRRDLRHLAQRLGSALPAEFQGLADLYRWVEDNGPWPSIPATHPAYFYALRARPGPNRDLVNMLLAELCPLDVRQLFICHKDLFYRTYATWSAEKKSYVAEFLAAEYATDKAGTRLALFGSEASMEEEPEDETGDDLIARVGPWGAIGRART